MNTYNPLYQQYQDRTLFVASFNLSPQQLGHITSDAPRLTALDVHRLYVMTRQGLPEPLRNPDKRHESAMVHGNIKHKDQPDSLVFESGE